MDIRLTKSQKCVIKNVQSGQSVQVDAVAGAGKTNVIQKIIESEPTKKFLVLMFNKLLQEETKTALGL